MNINISTVENELHHLGYMPISTTSNEQCIILHKVENGQDKCVAVISANSFFHRSIADTRAKIIFEIQHSRLSKPIKKNNLLICVQGVSGTSHHFIGKNIVFINNDEDKFYSSFISSSMKKEVEILHSYRNIEKDKYKQEKYLFPEEHRHMIFPLYILVGLIIYMYVINLFNHNYLGYSVNKVIDGEWQTMITYMFSHKNIYHLIVNCTALISLGSIVMSIEGMLGFSLIYFMGGFMAALTDCILIQKGYGSPDTITIGASGAIFALLGALLVESFSDFIMEQKRLQILMIIIPTLILSNVSKSVNVKVHISGFIIGAIITILVRLINRNISYAKVQSLRKRAAKKTIEMENLYTHGKKHIKGFIGPSNYNNNFSRTIYYK